MKLLNKDGDQFVFLVGKRERSMLLQLLQYYPMIDSGHFRPRTNRKSKELLDEKLLEEALAETRAENKRLLKDMLAETDRFVDNEIGFKFRVKRSELEWLLQILNDIRVGAWAKLGSPDPKLETDMILKEEYDPLQVTMNLAGFYQSAFLHAIMTE
ncbi:MAG: hypothetical protein ACO1QB_17050 [Verrucomicrobiales bacterium]